MKEKKYKYPAIKIKRKKGDEKFTFGNVHLDFQLNDFWSWNQSNLIENRTRGILAEFLVKQALGIETPIRMEWDDSDLETKNGTKIEVKSSAYLQSWEQEKLSGIQFDVSKKHFYTDNIRKRRSDYYVFCVLTCKEQNKVNPMDLKQWDFYVLETKILDEKIGEQKTITLNSLLNLKPKKCNFDELKNVII